MQNILFPVNFEFKITTLSNDFIAKDSTGQTIAFVKQKLFKFKEDISIFSDSSKSKIIYTIKADRWLDFSAAYSFSDEQGSEIGKIVRKGWRSIWKANYEIVDQHEQIQYHINEENGWIKVIDSVFGEIPVLGMFTGYFFNPSYLVSDLSNNPIMRIKKTPSFFGRKFELTQIGTLDNDDDDRIMLGLMMMVLLERRRG